MRFSEERLQAHLERVSLMLYNISHSHAGEFRV